MIRNFIYLRALDSKFPSHLLSLSNATPARAPTLDKD
jgi:hypothetical protein